MVRVHAMTTDKVTAWRVRDLLACHPLLGGGTAQIDVEVNHDRVILTGWIADERLLQLVERRVRGAVGRHAVSIHIQHGYMADGAVNPPRIAMQLR